MSNGLYLILVFTLIPLAVMVMAVVGRPLLTLPHRFFSRLSEDTAYMWGAVTTAFIGIALMTYLALSLAFSTGGVTPARLLRYAQMYALAFCSAPLAVVGLVVASVDMASPSPITSAESA
jgi:hypothetical protein